MFPVIDSLIDRCNDTFIFHDDPFSSILSFKESDSFQFYLYFGDVLDCPFHLLVYRTSQNNDRGKYNSSRARRGEVMRVYFTREKWFFFFSSFFFVEWSCDLKR